MLSGHGMADLRVIDEQPGTVDNPQIGERWIHRLRRGERAA